MEDKERRIVSFQVSGEELETIEIAAANQGVSRSEYLRTKVLSARSASTESNAEASLQRLEGLLRHLVYITSRTHVAVYSIAETAGTISTRQLREMYEAARTAGLEYMATLAERMAKAEAQIASQNRSDAPPEAA
jgi:hypothetical protein